MTTLHLQALENFPNYRGALRAICLTDDPWATPPAVDLLCSGFTGTVAERIDIRPGDAGAAKIGHFGFFRPEHRDTLWRDAAEWLGALALMSLHTHFRQPPHLLGCVQVAFRIRLHSGCGTVLQMLAPPRLAFVFISAVASLPTANMLMKTAALNAPTTSRRNVMNSSPMRPFYGGRA